ncbi:Flagellar motor switch protein FliM [Thermogutta terrifontis]|uniref:Flagellar motor switch protein FliM n=1 Tax=Thermogutta terrifontis TaxID=1331910 RepID=A0A286R9Y5_9BACT|nr:MULTISPECIES: flagellar motor switch protein FliM [Thermogutta]ASV72784.1 Flagellar motor switch protein FliM [Thermogutta terrifontis]MBC7353526.1 flagellar motor switch protein FliM [Thermogutta sp.]
MSSDEVLTQAEIESLLASVGKGKPAEAPRDVPTAPAASSPPPPVKKSREKIIPYDFKRPERVGKEQMRSLQTLHEGFSRNFAAGLSAMLRCMVEVKLTSVDQLTYSEFVFSLDNPTCFNLIRAEPLEGHFILDINPTILYPMIDRLLGGGREPTPITRRPLSEIERRLVGRITSLFLEELKRAWENVLPLELSVVRVESNPQLVQIVPPNEVIVLVSFELALGEVRGMANLCIPYNAIEPIANKLSANSWASYGKRQVSPDATERIGRALRTSTVQLVVQLARTTITTQDLIGLRVGDIITTKKDIHTPLLVRVEGIPKFLARPGIFKGHKAICIEDVISDPAQAVGE